MLRLDHELRRMFPNSDERHSPIDNAIRDVLAVAITINTHWHWPSVRLLAIDDVARTVTQATGMLVDHVKLVTPTDIAAEMLLWSNKDTLWDREVVNELRRRYGPDSSFMLERLQNLVKNEINDLAKYSVRKNFSRYDRDVQDQLVRQFGKVTGDACANHIALCLVGDHDACKRTGALVSLMVTAAPFMTRDPLNPHKLLILVDNDI